MAMRSGVLAAAAVLLLAGPAAGVAAAATTPKPAPGAVPGAASVGGGATTPFLDVFYRQVNHRLTLRSGSTVTDLGGRLTSGPSAISKSPIEFFEESVFVRGADNAIWFRDFSDGLGEWLPWRRLGGRSLGAPGTTCVGAATNPMIVYVRGTDRALWRKEVGGGGWTSLGGVLASDPAALPAVNGRCAAREDVFVLGSGQSVWERVGGAWHRVGGRSTVAPAVLQLADGETDLFVRGADNALWMNTRAPGATVWNGWRRIGGVLSSAPTATVFPPSPQTREVLALGGDGDLWQALNVVGTATWTWTEIP
jgi:hypothetical protein